jgi:hypothetical protein
VLERERELELQLQQLQADYVQLRAGFDAILADVARAIGRHRTDRDPRPLVAELDALLRAAGRMVR